MCVLNRSRNIPTKFGNDRPKMVKAWQQFFAIKDVGSLILNYCNLHIRRREFVWNPSDN